MLCHDEERRYVSRSQKEDAHEVSPRFEDCAILAAVYGNVRSAVLTDTSRMSDWMFAQLEP